MLYILSLILNFVNLKELHKVKICPRNGNICSGKCSDNEDVMKETNAPLHIQLGDVEWYKVTTLQDIFETFDKINDLPYRLVAGNTGQGELYGSKK